MYSLVAQKPKTLFDVNYSNERTEKSTGARTIYTLWNDAISDADIATLCLMREKS